MADPRSRRRFRWRRALDAAAAISMIVAAGTIVFREGPDVGGGPEVPREPLPLENLALKGDPRSTVGMIIYSDFQCPYCRRFALEVFPVVERDLIATGKLLVAFRHLPIDLIHPQAVAAASLAECARPLGRFWTTHDALFATPTLTATTIDALAADAGDSLRATCRAEDGLRIVNEHQRQAALLGIVSTTRPIAIRLWAAGLPGRPSGLASAPRRSDFRGSRVVDRDS